MFPVMSAGNPITGYNINNSLRFRNSASAYLSRTATTPTNNLKWTWSGWVKRGALNTLQGIFDGYSSGANWTTLFFNSDNTLYFYNVVSGVDYDFYTTALFRDPSAWYHIVCVYDSANATAANRVIIYVNGVSQSGSSPSGQTPQNQTSLINAANGQYLGRRTDTGYYFDGYLAEVNFIDGQALTPSSFGANDTLTGQWLPKQYSGTYGTNGFYLKFSDIATTSGSNAGLGKDSSGNGNYWTTNNISVTTGVTYDAMTDSPTLTSATVGNYATYNFIAKASSQPTFSSGNLDLSASAAWNGAVGTIGVTSGKWYWEVVNGNSDAFVGICGDNLILTTADPQALTGTIIYYGGGGSKRIDGADTAYGASYSTETIGVALDVDGGTVTFYKNNTSQGSISLSSSTLNGKTIFPFFVKYASTATVNFGQRPFTYTPPTGFVRLNTYNLPTPTIKAGNKYMDANTYTGTGAAQSITNAGSFQPDFIWSKARNIAYASGLFDSVRGASKFLVSNLTDTEYTNTTALTSFNSNGFSVGTDTSASINDSGKTYVTWQWKAGNSAGSSNTSGSITSTVSASTTAGFSVVTYTGNGSTNQTIGHGLGVAPKMIIIKNRSGAYNWIVYHTSIGATQFLYLNATDAAATSSNPFNNTAPTSSVFTVAGNAANNFVNANTSTYVAYCWAEIAGFSKFGSYTGNSSTDGSFIYLGFRPKFVIFKDYSNAHSWIMVDSSRNTYNVGGDYLKAESSAVENGSATVVNNTAVDFLSNGFKLRNAAVNSGENNGSSNYIYMAFAENPFKHSNAR